MEREVRYCTTEDGVRIAYSVEGKGPPLLILQNSLESLSLAHEFEERWREHLSAERQLVLYDMRGSGLSQREVEDLSNSALVLDIEAVVNATGNEPIDLWAGNLAGPRAIEYAARSPAAVRKLVLATTFARVHDVFSPEMLTGLAQLARANWDQATRTFSDMGIRRRVGDVALQFAAILRDSSTGETMARLIESNADLDLSHLLPQVQCPTLVISTEDTPTYPLSAAQRIASSIPNCRLISLKAEQISFLSDDYTGVGIARDFLDGIERSRGRPNEPATPASLRTVLFTDLVGHTEMMSRLGDERGRAVLREHETITRNVLNTHGGTEIKTMGDGFMASFSSVTKAVECAIALQRAFAEREGEPLSVRVGLNAGEPIEEDGDLFGATVILASRIAAKADAGEILVADTVRGLCSGKGFLFADRGEFLAKGFEEPMRVYEVRWRA
jgi:class 3 adenylate cyclase/pimeloyl-ACP methyl ester carboxylesterase